MRIIPKKTNVSMEFFNGFTAGDVAVGFIGAVIEVAIVVSNLPGKLYLMSGGLVILALLLLKLDDERNYEFLLNILRHYAYHRNYAKDQPEKNGAEAGERHRTISGKSSLTRVSKTDLSYTKKNTMAQYWNFPAWNSVFSVNSVRITP